MSKEYNENFNLVNDTTENLDEKDLLGTKVYSDTLFDIITNKKDNSPVTIGLFGSWGSGKSSIVNTLTNKLKDHKDVVTITYDAWKYSNDAFRRSFIMTLIDTFNIKTNDDQFRFYHDISEETEYKIGLNKIGFINILLASPILFFLVWFTSFSDELKVIFSMISVVAVAILSLLKGMLLQYKTTVSKPKFFSPEQFEEIFHEIINTLIQVNHIPKWIKRIIGKNEDVKKVVIVIDNIDRCDKETATELLLTIKNFLERENCIFLVPVDEEALQRHLNVGKNSDGEEFLRKIFNVSVRIKKFNNKDLFEYTNNIIRENELGFSPEVAEMVSMEFSRNPRRIIQFLNNISLENNIAIHQEKIGLMPQGSLTKNIEFMAKILLIKEEWSDLYEKINKTPNILNQINEKIKNADYEPSNGTYKFKVIADSEVLELNLEQYRFFKKTVAIDVKKPEHFFRIQDFNKDIPDSLFGFIYSQDWDEIQKLLETKLISIEKLFVLIEEELSNSINKYHLIDIRGYNIINLIFIIISEPQYDYIFENIYQPIGSIIDDAQIQKIIGKFHLEPMLNYAKKLSQKNMHFLRNFIVNEINSYTEQKQLLKSYLKYFNGDISSLKLVKLKFSNLLKEDVTIFEEFAELINTTETGNALITNEVIDHYIEKAIENVSSMERKEFNFLKKTNELFLLSNQQKFMYVSTISADISNNSDNNQTIILMDEISGFFQLNSNQLESIYNTLNNKVDQLYSHYYSGVRTLYINECIIRMIELMEELYNHIQIENHASINSMINYLNRIETDFYLSSVRSLGNIIEQNRVFNYSFSTALINKFTILTNIEQKKELIRVYGILLRKAEEIDGKIIGLNKEQIVEIIDILFVFLFENTPDNCEEVEKIIVSGLGMTIIHPFIEQKIKSISDVDYQKIILKFVSHINDISIIDLIIANILASSTDYSSLVSSINLINENIPKPDKLIKKVLLDLLAKVTTDSGQYYKDLLEASIENQHLFNKTDVGTIIEKLIPLIADDNKENKIFSFRKLNHLAKDSIPKEKIRKIAPLIEDVNFEELDLNEIMKELKSKFVS